MDGERDKARAASQAAGADAALLRALHPCRRLPDGCWPRRLELALADGYRTSVFLHSRPGAPSRLPVVYVHGIQSHAGWFVASAAAMAERGREVFQVTRRGSGDNRADRGHAQNAEQLLDDLDCACRLVRQRSQAPRLHLVAVSWGGKLAAAYAAKAARAAQLASLTLIAPGIVPRVDVSVGTKLAVAMSLIAAPRRRFDIPLSRPELFTDNPPMRDYLRGDLLAVHRATARLMYASRRLDRLVRRAPRGALDVATTLVLAERDRIISNDATRRVVERLTDEKAVVVQRPSAHVLEFEPDPTELFNVLDAALGRAEARPSG